MTAESLDRDLLDQELLVMGQEAREYYLQQLRTHEPRNGACPLCGLLLCPPRREAQALLMAAGVDLSDRPARGEELIEIYRRQYRDHRNDPAACAECHIPDCDLGRAAWQALRASGVNPDEVAL